MQKDEQSLANASGGISLTEEKWDLRVRTMQFALASHSTLFVVTQDFRGTGNW